MPGPGSYDISASGITQPSTPSFSIGLKHSTPRDLTPGPGTYSVSQADNAMRKSSKGVTIGSKQPDHPSSETPGPGAYETQRVFELKPKPLSFSDRHTDLYEHEHLLTPGPTRYDPSLALKLSHDKSIPCVFKSGATPRGAFDDVSHTPGPSAYSVNDSMITPRASVACIGRKQSVNYDNHVPGPGSYDNVLEEYIKMTTPTSPAFTLHEKPEHGGPFDMHSATEYTSVGPGTYTIDKVINQGGLILPHAASFASRHGDPLEKEKQLTPGPGTYFKESKTAQTTPQYDPLGSKGCKVGIRYTDSTFITSQTGLGTYNNTSVGPGSYTPRSVTPRTPGGVLGSKHANLQKSLGDGPAKYNISAAAVATLPSSVRSCMHNGRANELDSPFTTRFNCSCTGGPGSYVLGEKLQNNRLRGARALISSDSSRGPCSGRLGPSIGIRYTRTRKQNMPGPGEYDIQSAPRGPSFSFRSRTPMAVGTGERMK